MMMMIMMLMLVIGMLMMVETVGEGDGLYPFLFNLEVKARSSFNRLAPLLAIRHRSTKMKNQGSNSNRLLCSFRGIPFWTRSSIEACHT